MTIQSTQEAMAVLEATRTAEIAAGRVVARQILQTKEKTHVRDVVLEMKARALIPQDTTEYYWAGAIFRGREFEWTGEYANYEDAKDKERNIHERRPIKVWRLRK